MFRFLAGSLLAVHGLIHLMGFVKGFGLAPLEQLVKPISRPMGLLWLVAAVVLCASVATLFVAPRWFWLFGGVGIVFSQVAIATSWHDARFGTIPNALLLALVVYAAYSKGPFGLRAEYERLVRDGLAQVSTQEAPLVTEADLERLPEPVQRYLRFAGVVGTPRVRAFRVEVTGRIRSSAESPWMAITAEQHNFFDPPRRYFWLEAVRSGLPVDGLHAYGHDDASMRIRLLSLVPVVDLSGQDMMRGETVTLLNDMSVFAPAALLDPAIQWRQLDAHRVEARYTNGVHSIRSVLVFADTGALADFWSDDRPALAEDGKTLLSQRWSTPLFDYGTQGPYRLCSRGEARYAAPSGDYAYIELDVREVVINPEQ